MLGVLARLLVAATLLAPATAAAQMAAPLRRPRRLVALDLRGPGGRRRSPGPPLPHARWRRGHGEGPGSPRRRHRLRCRHLGRPRFLRHPVPRRQPQRGVRLPAAAQVRPPRCPPVHAHLQLRSQLAALQRTRLHRRGGYPARHLVPRPPCRRGRHRPVSSWATPRSLRSTCPT